jgi:hypothetical protein
MSYTSAPVSSSNAAQKIYLCPQPSLSPVQGHSHGNKYLKRHRLEHSELLHGKVEYACKGRSILRCRMLSSGFGSEYTGPSAQAIASKRDTQVWTVVQRMELPEDETALGHHHHLR